LSLGRLALAAGAALALCACARSEANAPDPRTSTIPAAVTRALPTPKPGPPWSPSDRERARRTLADIFESDIVQTSSALAVVAEDGSTLFDHRATHPSTPASTLKLVVGASALDRLGPSHRFVTRFVASAPIDGDGTLRGDLYLVGGGDPTLVSDDLRRGVGALWRTGLRRIEGSVVVDDTAFAGPEQNPRWDPDDLTYDYAAGTSAISLDEDTIEFDVTPNADGGTASIVTVPANSYVAFYGAIGTGSYDTDVTIERHAASTNHNVLEYDLDGHIARGGMQSYYKPVVGIPQYVGSVVATMLAQRGIALAGGFRVAAAPADAAQLWSHPSPPLDAIVREMLVNSNNHTAETLLRFLGESSGRAGTDASGIAFEKRVLSGLAVPRDSMALYDGSGLSPADRIMPLTLAKLIAAQTRGPLAGAFVADLPRVGLDGTVKHHDLHDALGRTRAKSGHIENVNGLAGTIATEHHGRVAFAFIVNDPRANADVVTEEEDRALDAIARM
jgi:D-alanyl-D-alanine carboxypeptidase/D-alanyl-D-alanine-endopeptidase (penicillin-binding protein 4)